MNIRWRVKDREGNITENKLHEGIADDADEAERYIREHQEWFDTAGYNAEQHYWWGRIDADPESLVVWTIE